MPETPSKREWVIEALYHPETGEELATISDQLAFHLSRLAIVLEDIGGVLAVGTDRVKLDDGSYRTVRAVIRWESFSPARRAPSPRPEPEPVPPVEAESPDAEVEPEPEPVAAG